MSLKERAQAAGVFNAEKDRLEKFECDLELLERSIRMLTCDAGSVSLGKTLEPGIVSSVFEEADVRRRRLERLRVEQRRLSVGRSRAHEGLKSARDKLFEAVAALRAAETSVAIKRR